MRKPCGLDANVFPLRQEKLSLLSFVIIDIELCRDCIFAESSATKYYCEPDQDVTDFTRLQDRTRSLIELSCT